MTKTNLLTIIFLLLASSFAFANISMPGVNCSSTSWDTSGFPKCANHGYNTDVCLCKGDLSGQCWACDDSSSGWRICKKSDSSCCVNNTSRACGSGCGGTQTCSSGQWGTCSGETQTVTYYQDADGDGKGTSTITTSACAPPNGYVTNNQDCDDTKANVYLNAPELCDGVDNDCNSSIDETFACVKGSEGCDDTCTYATRNADCSGTTPTNSEYNYGTTQGKYTQSFNGTTWDPILYYHHSITIEECAWKCVSGYTYNSQGTGTCISTTIITPPEGDNNYPIINYDYNSILSIEGQMESDGNVRITLQCSKLTKADLNFIETTKNNNLQISPRIIDCNLAPKDYSIKVLQSVEQKTLLTIQADISKSAPNCTTCARQATMLYETQKENQSIPDNSVVGILLILIVSIALITKKAK